MTERLQKQLDFALEIDKEKNIFRQTHLSGHGRNENDAEHAWHMAVMAYLLREYANEDIDISRVMLMCLIHDIVEIDAGDTYAYDEESKQTQKAREDAAKECEAMLSMPRLLARSIDGLGFLRHRGYKGEIYADRYIRRKLQSGTQRTYTPCTHSSKRAWT